MTSKNDYNSIKYDYADTYHEGSFIMSLEPNSTLVLLLQTFNLTYLWTGKHLPLMSRSSDLNTPEMTYAT